MTWTLLVQHQMTTCSFFNITCQYFSVCVQSKGRKRQLVQSMPNTPNGCSTIFCHWVKSTLVQNYDHHSCIVYYSKNPERLKRFTIDILPGVHCWVAKYHERVQHYILPAVLGSHPGAIGQLKPLLLRPLSHCCLLNRLELSQSGDT